MSRREWELCGLSNLPLPVVPVALGSWRCVGNCQVWPGAVPSSGGLGQSQELTEPDSRKVSDPSGSLYHTEPWLGDGTAGRSMVGCLARPAALMADPLLTVTSQMATRAERPEEPLRGHGQKDTASCDPQRSLLEALSLLSSDDW